MSTDLHTHITFPYAFYSYVGSLYILKRTFGRQAPSANYSLSDIRLFVNARSNLLLFSWKMEVDKWYSEFFNRPQFRKLYSLWEPNRNKPPLSNWRRGPADRKNDLCRVRYTKKGKSWESVKSVMRGEGTRALDLWLNFGFPCFCWIGLWCKTTTINRAACLSTWRHIWASYLITDITYEFISIITSLF